MATVVRTEHRARCRRRLVQAAVVLVLWGLITHGTFAGSGDEPHYLAIAHSLAFDADLDISNNYGANEPLLLAGTLQPEMHVRVGNGGILRPVHDIGLPLLFAPYVRVAVPVTNWLFRTVPAGAMRRARLTPSVLYRHFISIAMILLAGALAGQLLDAFCRMGTSPRAAAGVTLLLALSPPLLIFSVLFFTELITALIAFSIFNLCFWDDARGGGRWFAIGAMTGLLWLIHVKNIGLIVPLTALALASRFTKRERKEPVAFLSGLALLIGFRSAVNHHLWGTWLTSPHATTGAWPGWLATVQTMATRLGGMLVDQEFGLLVYAPVYVLAFIGWFFLAKHERSLAAWLAAIVGSLVVLLALPVTNVHGWTGGWSPAARFLAPLAPFLGLAVLSAVREGPRWIVVPVVVIQVASSVFFWQNPKLLWNDGDGRAAFCRITGEAICRALPSFVTPRTDVSPAIGHR